MEECKQRLERSSPRVCGGEPEVYFVLVYVLNVVPACAGVNRRISKSGASV